MEYKLILRRRDDMFVAKVFDKYREPGPDGLLLRSKILLAFRELGVLREERELDELFACFDIDKNGGLDLEEFKSAVQQPSDVEQWTDRLPLGPLIAHVIIKQVGGNSLQDISRLTDDQINSIFVEFGEQAKNLVREALDELKITYEALENLPESSRSGNCKFGTGGASGRAENFHEGLTKIIGFPHPDVNKGVEEEHCIVKGCDVVFKTNNYGIETTPKNEYRIAKGTIECPEKDKRDTHGQSVRNVKKLEDLMKCRDVQKAELLMIEVLTVVLYSGPMFQVYNSILRRFPEDLFKEFQFQQFTNTFTTTIHVLVSAVVKLARIQRLPSGLQLYRGLGNMRELPEHFYVCDEFGRRGYMEYGFMSTTTKKSVAVQYSGADTGLQAGNVLVITVGAIDRGACIAGLSQYPDEVEYLWAPGSFVELAGWPWLERGGLGLVRMVPVRVNANLKVSTVGEMQNRKKEMHLAALDYGLDEAYRQVEQLAREGGAFETRLQKDPFSVVDLNFYRTFVCPQLFKGLIVESGGRVRFTVEALLEKVRQEGKKMRSRHAFLGVEKYADDQEYRDMVEEMLLFKAASKSVVMFYLQDPAREATRLWSETLPISHEGYISFLWKTLPEDAAGRVERATELCRLLGLMRSKVDEVEGTTGRMPLHRAAASGAGERSLLCLVAAGADVNMVDRAGWTPAIRAASHGQAAALEVLHRSGADMNKPDAQGVTPAIVAALNGHFTALKILHSCGADMDKSNAQGTTPAIMAAQHGHSAALEVLHRSGADLNKPNTLGGTPAFAAALNGHSSVLEVLHRSGADLNKPNAQGITPAFVAAEKSHHAALEVLARCGADLNTPDARGATPATVAASNGHAAALEVLHRCGADLNRPGTQGATPAIFAAAHGHSAALEVLHSCGADFNRPDALGSTSAIHAALNGHAAALEVLDRCGADLDKPNAHGSTPALHAASKGHAHVLEVLHRCGADLNKPNAQGITPAFLVAEKSHHAALEVLARCGADLNTPDALGTTPATVAASNGHAAALEVLARFKVDLTVPAPNGITPARAARLNGHAAVLELFARFGASNLHSAGLVSPVSSPLHSQVPSVSPVSSPGPAGPAAGTVLLVSLGQDASGLEAGPFSAVEEVTVGEMVSVPRSNGTRTVGRVLRHAEQSGLMVVEVGAGFQKLVEVGQLSKLLGPVQLASP